MLQVCNGEQSPSEDVGPGVLLQCCSAALSWGVVHRGWGVRAGGSGGVSTAGRS